MVKELESGLCGVEVWYEVGADGELMLVLGFALTHSFPNKVWNLGLLIRLGVNLS